MTTRKNLGLALSLVLVIAFTGLALSFFWSGKTLAYTAAQINANRATAPYKYSFNAKDAKTITMNIAGKTLHFDLTNATPDPGNGQSAVSYIYQLRAGEDTDDNCRQGVLPIGLVPQTASIHITRAAIDTNPAAKIDANLSFFHSVGGKCQMTPDIQTAIQVNNTFGKDLVVDGGTGSGGSGAASDNTSDCVTNSNIGLEWLLCPLITSVSKATDGINALVVRQLNFNVDENLSDNPGNDGVKIAWAAIKNIASALVVILLLVIVISQALGGGGFLDAYTLRKMLPRLVVAVIAMQLSWYACRYAIGLANDAGHGIAQIMTSPFGGAGNLDLSSLLNRLSGWWAAGASVTSVSLVVVLVAAPVIATTFLPGVLLIIFTLFVSVLVALATLLFRNALIIALVIFSPIALLLWVLPGTQRYWKMWTSNFSKLLLLFPLMISIIYAGRIFAYIAGGLGTPGFLDLLAVLVGFFAPYFIIFKAFKWGGSALAAGSNAISQSGALRRGREVGRKELGEWQKRNMGEAASKYDPDKNRTTRLERAKARMLAGNFIPTERGRRTTIQKGSQWKSERNEEALALNNRQYEMGLSKGYDRIDPDTGKREHIEPGMKAAKQGLVDMVGYDGKDPLMQRASQMAVVELMRTNSFWEMQNAKISSGKYAGMRVQDTEVWQRKLQTDPDMWGKAGGKRPDTIPTVTAEEYGSDDEQISKTLGEYAPENPVGKDGKPITKEQYIDRRVQEVKELQKKVGPNARLTDADRLTKALRHGYADAPSSPGYAEGFWDEMIAQASEGNTASQEEMLKQFKQVAGSGQAGLGVLNPLAAGPLRVKVNKALGGNEDNDILGQLVTAARSSNPADSAQILEQIKPSRKSSGDSGQSAATPAAPETSSPAATTGGGGSSGTSAPSGGAVGGGGAPAGAKPSGGTVSGEGGFDYNAMTEAVARGTRRGVSEAQPGQAIFTPSTTRVETQGGVLEIPHQPGETISPGGVILPPGSQSNPERGPSGPVENPPEEPPANP